MLFILYIDRNLLLILVLYRYRISFQEKKD